MLISKKKKKKQTIFTRYTTIGYITINCFKLVIWNNACEFKTNKKKIWNVNGNSNSSFIWWCVLSLTLKIKIFFFMYRRRKKNQENTKSTRKLYQKKKREWIACASRSCVPNYANDNFLFPINFSKHFIS